MMSWHEFIKNQIEQGAVACQVGDVDTIACYGEIEAEYAAARDAVAIVDRSYRGVLEITGKDRKSWLHNLTTNQIKPLSPGQGNYAFAVNLKGRIQFDMNVLVRPESILLDIDARFLTQAISHFDKYIIIEDVRVENCSDAFVRLGLVGPQASLLLSKLGAATAGNLAVLQSAQLNWQDENILFFRHDFCGLRGFELLLPPHVAPVLWKACVEGVDGLSAVPVGYDAQNIHRIEVGICWPVSEINADVLPAETMQLQRAVSFNKGCYLGQEIVERMHARQVLARRLVAFSVREDCLPPPGAKLTDSTDKTVGNVTSSCQSVSSGQGMGLGYVKSAFVKPGTQLHALWGQNKAVVTIKECG